VWEGIEMKIGLPAKIVLIVILIVFAANVLAACSAADVASQNLSTEADNFKITRRIVFYNGVTGEYILQVEGRCSLGNNDAPGSLSVTCKVSEDQYKKHFLGLSDNVTYFAEQIDASVVSEYHYKVVFKPSVIIPDVEIQ